jgi:citrate lyase beta subunit
MDRQPVHTVYGGAHLFKEGTIQKLGNLALRSLETNGADASVFAAALGIPPALAETVHARVVAKLQREPVEDYRIDFEDGYGVRSEAEELTDAVRTAQAASDLPPFFGIRIKPIFNPQASATLKTFLANLEHVPENFAVTLPKVTSPEEVQELSALLDQIESERGFPARQIRIELMIETPQAIYTPDGRVALPELVRAAAGRCRGAHFGPYDYTASLGIAAEHQSLDHPACEFARHVMQAALGGSGIHLADGPFNILPIPPREAVHQAWRMHFQHVQRSLRNGFYQGWDLHPAQLPSRYAAVFAFYLQSLPQATARLQNFLDRSERATRVGSIFDDAATGRGLFNFFRRGLSCGALTREEAPY